MKSLDSIMVAEPMWNGYNGETVLISLSELKKRIKWNQYLNSVEIHNGKYGWYDNYTRTFLERDYGFVFCHEFSFADKKTAETAIKKYLSFVKNNLQEVEYFNKYVSVKKFPKNMDRCCVWKKNNKYDYSPYY